MDNTLNQLVKQLKAQGMTAIMVHKYLRDHNAGIPWVTTLRLYNSV